MYCHQLIDIDNNNNNDDDWLNPQWNNLIYWKIIDNNM